MKKKILLVTTGQPSLNPRLVKEADSLSKAGYEVTVIYQYWNEWGFELDAKLLNSKLWQAIQVGGDPHEQKFSYYRSRVIHKIYKVLAKITLRFGIAERAISRSFFCQLRKARSINYDFCIGHNLGSLPVVVLSSKYRSMSFAFDAEDFHRHETSNLKNHFDVKLKTFLENKYFPKLSYLTAASPLIHTEYSTLFPKLKIVTIFNVFEQSSIIIRPSLTNPLKLFWFSQTIGKNRGLEDVISALSFIPHGNFELHLLGYSNPMIRADFIALLESRNMNRNMLYFYDPIPSDDIIDFANQFDIGLASETGKPYNREICLTNKLFTYLHAGLALLCSDTLAQQQFMTSYTGLGYLYKKKAVESIVEALYSFLANPTLLITFKENSVILAKKSFNWKLEEKKLLSLISERV